MGNFKKLQVWQKAKDIAVEIYKLTDKNEFRKDYGLKDQIRRAYVSIASNIAEWDERFSNKESIRFLYIANGSIAEVITQLCIAYDIEYIKKSIYENMLLELENLSKQIKTLIKYRAQNEQR